jgi:hypothetical protein
MAGIGRHRQALLLWTPVILFIAVVSFQLLGPIPIGLANNNDFPRILGSLRLWPASAVPPFNPDRSIFRFFVPDYLITDPRWDSGIPSSEWLIALAARQVSEVVLPKDRFDLRVMGVIHALLMALALAWFMLALRSRQLWIGVSSAVLILWIWTDVTYVQQFSSAYTAAGKLRQVGPRARAGRFLSVRDETTAPLRHCSSGRLCDPDRDSPESVLADPNGLVRGAADPVGHGPVFGPGNAGRLSHCAGLYGRF